MPFRACFQRSIRLIRSRICAAVRSSRPAAPWGRPADGRVRPALTLRLSPDSITKGDIIRVPIPVAATAPAVFDSDPSAIPVQVRRESPPLRGCGRRVRAEDSRRPCPFFKRERPCHRRALPVVLGSRSGSRSPVATAMPSASDPSLGSVTAGRGPVTVGGRGGFSSITRADSSKCCTSRGVCVRCGGRCARRLNAGADEEVERHCVRERCRAGASARPRRRICFELPCARRRRSSRGERPKWELARAGGGACGPARPRLPTATLADVPLAAQVRFATGVPVLPRSCCRTTARIQVCSSAAACLLLRTEIGTQSRFQVLHITCLPGDLQRFDSTCLTMRPTYAAEAAVQSSDSDLRHAPCCDP
jgi:hypothetical protein